MTGFNVLTIRAFGQDYPPGRLYPQLSDEGDQAVATELEDGPDIRGFTSASLAVYELGGRMPRRLASTPPNDLIAKHHSIVQITDCRVTMVCEKFTKGSTWIGGGLGAAVAVGAMAVSAAKARRRRGGKVMIGHLRYEWLSRVGASLPNSFGMNAYVILEYRDGPTAKAVHINCNGIEPATVAQDITRRAAAHRLAQPPELSSEERGVLESLRQAEPLRPAAKERAFYELPGSVVIRTAARPSRR